VTPSGKATQRAWGAAWRRSAQRWERIRPRLAAATGWKIWNPGSYGQRWHRLFREIYPLQRPTLLLFGLNPGPYGMAQTGIPFTDIKRLTSHLPSLARALAARGERIQLPGLAPRSLRPFLGRSFESSSVRVYRFLDMGWGNAETGWRHVGVANACPLLFVDQDGVNCTPADLFGAVARNLRDRKEARRLAERCDRLRRLAALDAVQALSPSGVVMLGKDTQRVLAPEMEKLFAAGSIVRWEHPARAVPDLWAAGLLKEVMREGLK
jgi:single-strand selective monofunctional uracil DNA glycosylase